ncbi:sugar kinase [Streptomyces sp. NPDC007851]|uniref:sugar kinase n=1 Tax=Streptomyces sp. NPDC007851 TaxID=3155008 RepID=UPI00340C9512
MKATDAVDAPETVDVVALGESMVTFLPGGPGRLADVPSFDRAIGGAESNVACGLAAAGHSVRWVSRVGTDGFGDHLVATVASYGVDVSCVGRDAVRPTGVYFRTAGDRATDAHEVAYYRAGSAASAMSVETVDLAGVRAGRVLHLSGITAALSEGCLGLLRELTAAAGERPLVSFDVNYRPSLWSGSGGTGAGVLLELARRADVVFVGMDEAEQAWGVGGGPEAVRELLTEPAVLVVKDGAKGATAFVSGAARWGLVAQFPAPLTGRCPAASRQAMQLRAGVPQGGTGGRWGSPRASEAERGGGTLSAPVSAPTPAPTPGAFDPAATPGTFEPAPAVDVVAAVGAGDAFAAGFLSGVLRGLTVRRTLRLGHLFAAAALTSPADLAPPPARDTTERLTALDDTAWERLRLGPGWTQADAADEEVRTP